MPQKTQYISCDIATCQTISMTRYFIFTLFGLVTASFNMLGQKHHCEIKFVQLKFVKSQEIRSGKMSDSILATAMLTNTILVSNDEIETFKIKTDSGYCMYAGQPFLTSHQYLLTKKAALRLSSLQVPLCCGIPLAVYVDGKEVYWAMLWNIVSSFGNEGITAILIGHTLTFINQLPAIPDFRNGALVNKRDLVDCLLKR